MSECADVLNYWPEAEEEKTHTDALAQLAEPAVMSEAVSFRKVISGLEKATFTV